MAQREGDRFVVRLQSDPLSVDEAYRFVQPGNVGAISLFVGTTRTFTEGRGETVQLEYDCYPEMALEEMARLCDSTIDAHGAERLFIVHRTGLVAVGEASVIVAASSAHRHQSLMACRHLIDTLKQTVPIWKKEIYSDGATDWVQGGGPESRLRG